MVSKKFDELLVKDLKTELSRLNLNTTGSKADLLSRLRTALEAEGKNPDSMEFLCEDEKTDKSVVTMESLTDLLCKLQTSLSEQNKELSDTLTDKMTEQSDKLNKELTDKMSEQGREMSDKMSDQGKALTDIW
uniref:SAP domain-containing protein n=1 Tax=Cacopsylla melanoneura TaxID=428564 RepID=A0A8D8QQV6_9HEMI